jgi:hypothetical protein
VCFRLLAALPGVSTDELEQLAVANGLDVRVSAQADRRFVEIAWGDCACSLYTRKEGRDRAVCFVDAILARGWTLQLLLFNDGETFDWQSGSPIPIPLEDFRREGLQALPDGKVASLA